MVRCCWIAGYTAFYVTAFSVLYLSVNVFGCRGNITIFKSKRVESTAMRHIYSATQIYAKPVKVSYHWQKYVLQDFPCLEDVQSSRGRNGREGEH